jgi:hypothetical protein
MTAWTCSGVSVVDSRTKDMERPPGSAEAVAGLVSAKRNGAVPDGFGVSEGSARQTMRRVCYVGM